MFCRLVGRNVAWAERAVREAVSLSALEALEQKVIDMVADDLDDLLAQAPQAMQLRYLQTLTSIAGDKSNTIVFPLVGDFLDSLMRCKGD